MIVGQLEFFCAYFKTSFKIKIAAGALRDKLTAEDFDAAFAYGLFLFINSNMMTLVIICL